MVFDQELFIASNCPKGLIGYCSADTDRIVPPILYISKECFIYNFRGYYWTNNESGLRDDDVLETSSEIATSGKEVLSHFFTGGLPEFSAEEEKLIEDWFKETLDFYNIDLKADTI